MSKYLVKNLHEDSSGNWIRFWEQATGLTATSCHRIGCYAAATDGAHVKLADGSNKWYIVPLCHKCNCQFGATFWVEGPLVPVNGGSILW